MERTGAWATIWECPMSSYHIQDLRLLLPTLDFDLRVNKHCAKVSAQFREWLLESLRGDTAGAEELSEHRFDLLCSLCFPTIDPPQLLRISKLCALTFLVDDGYIQTGALPSQWLTSTGYVPRMAPSFKVLNQPAAHSGSTPDPNLLNPEHFLEVARSMRTRRAQELGGSTPAASGTNLLSRFAGNLLSSLYSSRETNPQTSHPGLLEFLSVLENVHDRKFSKGLIGVTPFTSLWRCTTNIVMWSQVI